MASIPKFNWSEAYPPGTELAWEIALLFPPQGAWNVDEYLELTERSNQLVEYTAGRIEVLEMPTIQHQRILAFLLRVLQKIEEDFGGMAIMAPHPTTLTKDKIREPDLIYKLPENLPKPDEKYFYRADLVMEIVSADPESQKRDYKTKVLDYAEAGIPEYWIVDPQKKQITVLTLDGDQYATHGVFSENQTANSQLIPDLVVDVAAVLAAGKIK